MWKIYTRPTSASDFLKYACLSIFDTFRVLAMKNRNVSFVISSRCVPPIVFSSKHKAVCYFFNKMEKISRKKSFSFVTTHRFTSITRSFTNNELDPANQNENYYSRLNPFLNRLLYIYRKIKCRFSSSAIGITNQ
jgi:hypothetical protein